MKEYKQAAHHIQLYLCQNENADASDVLLLCTKLNKQKNYSFWFNHLTSLNEKLNDGLSNGELDNVIKWLYELDMDLNIVAKKCEFNSNRLKDALLTHFRGQFCLNTASFLLLRDNSMTMVMPILALATEAVGIISETYSIRNICDENQYLQKEAKWRIFQSVSVLENNLSKSDNRDTWQNLKKILPDGCVSYFEHKEIEADIRRLLQDLNWKEKFYRNLFGEREIPIDGSHWIHSNEFGKKNLQTTWKWPNISEQIEHDPSILPYHVYSLIARNIDPQYTLKFSDSTAIQHKTDMYAFLFA